MWRNSDRRCETATGDPLVAVSRLRVRAADADLCHDIVSGIDFHIGRGETLGIVGESGSGKTLTCRALIGLLDETLAATGDLGFDGERFPALAGVDRLRGGRIGMIFQDPLGALNPVRSIGAQLREILRRRQSMPRRQADAAACQLLTDVGVPSPAMTLAKYPHQLSGGLNQRATIAMALAGAPKLLIADEPTTALDVTVQAQILALLARLRRAHGLSMLLITHDLGVVAAQADRVAVMYAGRIVETADADVLMRRPRHPYTAALLEALPRMGDDRPVLPAVPGVVPPVGERPPGCVFAPRCPRADRTCIDKPPAPHAVGDGTIVSCHLPLP